MFQRETAPASSSPLSPLQSELWDGEPRAQEWERLLGVLRRCGGVATPDQLAGLVRPHRAEPVTTVLRWLAQRSIVGLSGHGQLLIPLCQFDRATMQPRPDIAPVLRELADAFDDWEIVSWLVEPNDWLDKRAPVDCLDGDPHAVLQAARADRFIAGG